MLPVIVAFVAINTPLCPTLNTAFVSLAPFLLLLSPAQNANLPVFEDIPVLLELIILLSVIVRVTVVPDFELIYTLGFVKIIHGDT